MQNGNYNPGINYQNLFYPTENAYEADEGLLQKVNDLRAQQGLKPIRRNKITVEEYDAIPKKGTKDLTINNGLNLPVELQNISPSGLVALEQYLRGDLA